MTRLLTTSMRAHNKMVIVSFDKDENTFGFSSLGLGGVIIRGTNFVETMNKYFDAIVLHKATVGILQRFENNNPSYYTESKDENGNIIRHEYYTKPKDNEQLPN